MMLLDTQSLVWLVQEPEQLGRKATRLIAEEPGPLCFSAVSCWELGMLIGKGRITLNVVLRDWIDTLVDKGVIEIGVDRRIATDAGTLPGNIHGDPGDRLIIASARALGCALVTSDRKILAYAAAGHVQAIDARR